MHWGCCTFSPPLKHVSFGGTAVSPLATSQPSESPFFILVPASQHIPQQYQEPDVPRSRQAWLPLFHEGQAGCFCILSQRRKGNQMQQNTYRLPMYFIVMFVSRHAIRNVSCISCHILYVSHAITKHIYVSPKSANCLLIVALNCSDREQVQTL